MSDDLFPRASEIMPGDTAPLTDAEHEELRHLAVQATRALMTFRHKLAVHTNSRGEVFEAAALVHGYLYRMRRVMMHGYLGEHPEAGYITRPRRSWLARWLGGRP